MCEKIDNFIDFLKKGFNISSFIDYIYNFCNVKRNNKYTEFINENGIYIESERPIDQEKIKIFSVSYFYSESPRKQDIYIKGLKKNIKRIHNLDIYKDYYLYLYIDCSVIAAFDYNKEVLNMFKEILKYDKVLIQFYYFNRCINIINNKFIHNNCAGAIARYLPYIYNDNLLEFHIRDIDTLFTSYLNYYCIQDFMNSNKLIYFYKCRYNNINDEKNLNHRLNQHIQYSPDNYLLHGGYLGMNNTINDNDKIFIFSEFKNTLLTYINNETNTITTKDYFNYRYGSDEVLLLYIRYSIIHLNIIKYFNINDIKFINDITNTNITDIIFNKYLISTKVNLSQHFNYIMLITIYNFDYIKEQKLLYTDFKYILNWFNINIKNLEKFIDNIKDYDQYKDYYKIYHFPTYNDFIQNNINYVYIIHPELQPDQNIKIIHYYNSFS